MTDSQKGPDEFLKIEWEEDDQRFVYHLKLNEMVQFNLAARPISKDLQGRDLVEALQARGVGAILHDTDDGLPAIQTFSLSNGNKIYQCYYRNGLARDPGHGEPASQTFDPETGMIIDAVSHSRLQRAWRYTASECAELSYRKWTNPGLPDALKSYQMS